MKYRRFGGLDWEVSALGFGTMRLPVIGEDSKNVDQAEAIRMIRYAIDHGINYVDTAYTYHGGNSEIILGKVLMDGYRERIRLATKLPSWLVKSRADMDRILGQQLNRLKTDYIDFYLLHSLNKQAWNKLLELKILDWVENVVSEGKLRYLGFSFHDEYEVLKEIVDAYDWTFCQIQYNYENENIQAGTKGLEYAAGKGLAVVIMEPLLGGMLTNPPDAVRTIWDRENRNPVDMAFQWLWNKPEISVVLSGMSAMEQVRQNIQSASTSGVGTLTQNDLDLVARVHAKYQEIRPIPCTKCEYCMPCPNGVNIPRNFELYNVAIAYNNPSSGKEGYNRLMPKEQRASSCEACGTCEEKCPQHIQIREWMPRVHEALSSG